MGGLLEVLPCVPFPDILIPANIVRPSRRVDLGWEEMSASRRASLLLRRNCSRGRQIWKEKA